MLNIYGRYRDEKKYQVTLNISVHSTKMNKIAEKLSTLIKYLSFLGKNVNAFYNKVRVFFNFFQFHHHSFVIFLKKFENYLGEK